MKQDKKMIVLFMAPAVLAFCLMFLYPVIRTVIMSLFEVRNVTDAVSTWQFIGFENFMNVLKNATFRQSMLNIFRIWLVGGIVTMSISLLFAVLLTNGIKGKSAFRAIIYLPNVVSAVALATMWTQYVFQSKYGLFNNIIRAFGGRAINWLGPDMKFWSMLIAFIFGSVGYYMLIFLSGIERIPTDIYEAATIDGAGKGSKFRYITLPLLRGVFKTNLTFWTINTITFFVWSKMFSPVDSELSTVSPVVHMMNLVFGGKATTGTFAGRGAAVGVLLAICVMLTFGIFNLCIKDDDIEL